MKSVRPPSSSRRQHASASNPAGISTQRPVRERAERHVHEAVRVVERQDVGDHVRGAPVPGLRERSDLRREAPVRVDGPLRLSRRPARVEDEGPASRLEARPRATRPGPVAPGRLLERAEPDPPLGRQRREPRRVRSIDEGVRHPRVVEDVRVLGGRVREGERDRDAPGAPDAEESLDERRARRSEDPDALLLERRTIREKCRGDPVRRDEKAAVRRPRSRVDDGDLLPVPGEDLEERQRSKISLQMISRWIWLVPS